MTRDFNGERGTENGERFFLKHIEIARVFIIKKNPFAPYIPGGADPGFGPSFFIRLRVHGLTQVHGLGIKA